MANHTAFLFDLDGTLLDTAPEFTHCLNQLLAEEGRAPVTEKDLRSFVSFGAKGMVSFAFKLSTEDPLLNGELIPRFLALYQNELGRRTRFFTGMEEGLHLLIEKAIPWGIVTNKPLRFTTALVAQFDTLKRAQCVVAGDSLPVSKPDPAPLLHAATLLEVAPLNCWYIGDARTDIEASKSAKMRSAIAYYGYIPPDDDPLTWQADSYLDCPKDIEKLLA